MCYLATETPPSPKPPPPPAPPPLMNIGQFLCAAREEAGTKGGQREERVKWAREREREGWAAFVSSLAVRRLCVSWAGCLLIGKQRAVGGQIRVAVGWRVREGIQTKAQTTLPSLPLFFPSPLYSLSLWNECNCCCSSVDFALKEGLGTDSCCVTPTHQTTAQQRLVYCR